ncbi:MAG: 3D domain-containing protein [Verrucomicrobia bacterium]|nr:3D domain-containing protein [Verrucomicrobiota bacterium]
MLALVLGLLSPVVSASAAEIRWVRVTAYCPCEICCGPHACGLTATGRPAVGRIAAVDPRRIKLGAMVHIPGHGWNVAADTGRLIKGPSRVDLLLESHEAARRFGVRWLPVTILTRAEWRRKMDDERFEARFAELVAAGRRLTMTMPGGEG